MAIYCLVYLGPTNPLCQGTLLNGPGRFLLLRDPKSEVNHFSDAASLRSHGVPKGGFVPLPDFPPRNRRIRSGRFSTLPWIHPGIQPRAPLKAISEGVIGLGHCSKGVDTYYRSTLVYLIYENDPKVNACVSSAGSLAWPLLARLPFLQALY
ncbi:uncharacterized protein BO96DRAFT_329058 [Aspergillus niger CBS 101883]|uniref:Uncharacterized protein n=2 Tax=Aspergillus niger TaxID=5061 RepID=A5AAG1_ASPNC|nr:uncharacterized protein BO96DRAFT_329058 [Aspergillus niger CBS 101883]XP_059603487.1 hypothetical protein An02g10540 [Aspergillus niger]PYH59827.1 hypothetical protein BO96DRAFT_329058 [Aspergillus niger CBS 101883]CAK44403.1 hypothetical protein An02g10540 [Aspergillus niger]